MKMTSFLGESFRDGPKKTYLSDDWVSLISCERQKFRSVDEFRESLIKYAVVVEFVIVFAKNNSSYVHAVCECYGIEHCEWYVKASVSSSNGCFYIRELNNVHNCKGVLRTNKHVMLGSKVVTSLIESDVGYNVGLKPADIISKLHNSYGFDITYKVALLSKRKAMERLYGSNEESFMKLSWYRDEVLLTNPGSSFVLEVNEQSKKFERVFVAYGGAIEGFKYCLPVLYVDGTFGKSIYKGQILSATGRTANKGTPFSFCFDYCPPKLLFLRGKNNVIAPQNSCYSFLYLCFAPQIF